MGNPHADSYGDSSGDSLWGIPQTPQLHDRNQGKDSSWGFSKGKLEDGRWMVAHGGISDSTVESCFPWWHPTVYHGTPIWSGNHMISGICQDMISCHNIIFLHGVAMTTPWHCLGKSLALPWHGHCIAVAMPWHCRSMAMDGMAMAQPWHCHGMAVALPWHCHGMPQRDSIHSICYSIHSISPHGCH